MAVSYIIYVVVCSPIVIIWLEMARAWWNGNLSEIDVTEDIAGDWGTWPHSNLLEDTRRRDDEAKLPFR